MSTQSNAPHPVRLAKGGHDSPEDGLCFNEAAAWVAGEPHSDIPKCVSPVIRRFSMTLNDRLDDDRRQLLVPFVLRSIGTAGDGRDQERREMCLAWLIEHLPAIYERAGLTDAAEQPRGTLTTDLADENVRRILWNAREQAWAARRKAYDGLRARVTDAVRAELAKNPHLEDDEAAVAAAAAVAAVAEAAAVAAVVAAVAVAAVAAVAAEAAEAAVAAVAAAAEAAAEAAAAAAAAVEAAAAAAAAAAVVVAAAVAAAAEAAAEAFGSSRYWSIRAAVRKRLREIGFRETVEAKVREQFGPSIDELLPSALNLFDRLLPQDPLQPPAVEGAELLFPVGRTS